MLVSETLLPGSAGSAISTRESGCPGNWAVPRCAQVMACVVSRSRKSHGGKSSRLVLLRRAGQFLLLRRYVRARRSRSWQRKGSSSLAVSRSSSDGPGSRLGHSARKLSLLRRVTALSYWGEKLRIRPRIMRIRETRASEPRSGRARIPGAAPRVRDPGARGNWQCAGSSGADKGGLRGLCPP